MLDKLMLFVTGDTHGEEGRFWYEDAAVERTLTLGDKLFICGDFGYIFDGNDRERSFLDYLAKKPYMVLFVDGNHENFDLLASYPIEIWCGGKVHAIRKDSQGQPKIIHLMRGQIYEIEKYRFFCFGGGYSIDKGMRQEGRSWWPQEMPTDAEMKEAIDNLAKHDYKVDYIITHAAPEDTMNLFYPNHQEEKALNNFLEWVREVTTYRHWYFGHLHEDKDLYRNQTVLWFDVRNMETNESIEIA